MLYLRKKILSFPFLPNLEIYISALLKIPNSFKIAWLSSDVFIFSINYARSRSQPTLAGSSHGNYHHNHGNSGSKSSRKSRHSYKRYLGIGSGASLGLSYFDTIKDMLGIEKVKLDDDPLKGKF